jgi:predicted dehydrogenase
VTGDPISQICADKTTFLPDRTLDEDVNALLRFRGGGKGVLTISQVACGEENGLILRVYGTQGAIKWAHENPNYMELYRYGEPRRTLTRATGYLSEAAAEVTRIPPGHPEGYLEGFAAVYADAIRAIRRHIDGQPLKIAEYKFPTVHDGLRGMQFIYAAYESATNGSVWTDL